jgi:hypothetical protein
MQAVSLHTNDQARGRNKRCFIRHPVTFTVQCRKEGHREATTYEMRDISFGGMSFVSSDCYAPGDLIEMTFPVHTVRNRIPGEIIWSSPLGLQPGTLFSNGLKFLCKHVLFMARMIEQMCCIEQYREAQTRQRRRTLSGDEAAREWILMCAARFPGG